MDVGTIRLRGGEQLGVKLNNQAFEYAKQMVQKGRFVYDDQDMWSEHQPSSGEENTPQLNNQ